MVMDVTIILVMLFIVVLLRPKCVAAFKLLSLIYKWVLLIKFGSGKFIESKIV